MVCKVFKPENLLSWTFIWEENLNKIRRKPFGSTVARIARLEWPRWYWTISNNWVVAGGWPEGGRLKPDDHQTILGTPETLLSVNYGASAFLSLDRGSAPPNIPKQPQTDVKKNSNFFLKPLRHVVMRLPPHVSKCRCMAIWGFCWKTGI